MTADITQTAIIALAVLGAAAYLGRTVWHTVSSARRAKAHGGCASGCGCSGSAVKSPRSPAH